MKTLTLFIKSSENEHQLSNVSKKVFHLFGINIWEERFSSNYPPDEHYFLGYAENASVRIFDTDDDRLDYPFTVSVEDTDKPQGSGFLNFDAPALAQILANKDFSVFEPYGEWHRIDWDGKGKLYSC